MKKQRFHQNINKKIHEDSFLLLESYTDHEYNFIGSLQHEITQFIGRIFFNKAPKLNRNKNYLNISCGEQLYNHEIWINSDCFQKNAFFKNDNIWKVDARYLPLKISDNSLDGIFSEHTLEHMKARHVLNLLCEFYRILKVDSTVRIILPDCSLYASYYFNSLEKYKDEFNSTWPTGAECIRGLTQYIGHESTWDINLMTRYLKMAGFSKINSCVFNEGCDPELLKDNPNRIWNSFYIEATK
jgi:predicted SAM-dependent methyltransferase